MMYDIFFRELQWILSHFHCLTNSDKENEKGFVRVYPGKLQLQIEDAFVNVPVDNDTNITDLMRDALNRFGLQDNKIEDYRWVLR